MGHALLKETTIKKKENLELNVTWQEELTTSLFQENYFSTEILKQLCF